MLDKCNTLWYNTYMQTKENKTSFIIVRVTDNEKELFNKDCIGQNKTISELARERLGFN